MRTLLALFIALVCGLGVGCGLRTPPSVTVVFKEPKGLSTGDAVLCRDLRIGRVASVAPGEAGATNVGLAIDAEYSQYLKEKAVFYAPAHDASRPATVVVIVPDMDAPPLPVGAVVHGADTPFDVVQGVVAGDVKTSLEVAAIALSALGLLVVLLRIIARGLTLLLGAAAGVAAALLVGPSVIDLVARHLPPNCPVELVSRAAVGGVVFVAVAVLAAAFLRAARPTAAA